MKAKEIRSKAWNTLKGKYWWAVLAALIASLFGVISLGASSVSADQTQEITAKTEEAVSSMPSGAVIALVIIVLGVLVVSLAMSVLSGAVRLGYARFNMNLFADAERPTINLLFSRLGITWKAFLFEIVKGLLIMLATFLLIVPGILLGLGYSQCEYILAENPEMKIGDVLRKSREIMKGNKWRLFCLGLSFLGWDILAGIVPAGPLFLAPYTQAADAAFYLDLTGRLNAGAEAEEAANA